MTQSFRLPTLLASVSALVASVVKRVLLF